MSQRAAFVNSTIPSALTFILLNAMIDEVKELKRLAAQIKQVEEALTRCS